MAELPAGTRAFGVQVQVGIRPRQQLAHVGQAADQIDERRGFARLGVAEWQAEDRAEVVLELARGGTLERPVPRVVDPR